MQKIKWGIIGPGSIAHQFAAALTASDKGELYAVASRNHDRAQAFAQQYGATHHYDSYQRLLDDPQVDFVYVATPHSHHFQTAKMCLQAGKHVLMEKPLTINARQTAELIKLAEQNRRVFQEALWSRFMPCFAKVREWIRLGEIGEVQYITSQIGFMFLDSQDHRLLNPALAGGALLDLGVYSISLSQFLLGEYPANIQATSVQYAEQVDKNTLVNMTYPSGASSQFTCTIAAQCSNAMSIHGTQGSIHLPAHFWNGNAATLSRTEQQALILKFPHAINGFEYQIEASMDCLEKGLLCADVMNHQDSLNVMRSMDEVRRQIGLTYDDSIESVS